MSKMPGIFAASALALGLLSAGPSQAADKVRDAVEKGIRQFVAAADAHDAAGIARLYATDAAVFPPGAARVDGRPAIEKFWQGMLAAGVSKLSVRTIEVQSSGNLAYDVGQFALDAPGKDGQPVHSAGKYVVVWKRTKGVWQLYRDIWNETP